jgi:hypothetical protein
MASITVNTQPISEELFEAFLQCRYKSKLRIAGVEGQPSEFEEHRRRLHAAYRQKAQHRLAASCGELEIVGPSVDCRGIGQGHKLTLKALRFAGCNAGTNLSSHLYCRERLEPCCMWDRRNESLDGPFGRGSDGTGVASKVRG